MNDDFLQGLAILGGFFAVLLVIRGVVAAADVAVCRSVTRLPVRMIRKADADRALERWCALTRAGIAPHEAWVSYQHEVGCLHVRWDNDPVTEIYSAWWDGAFERWQQSRGGTPAEWYEDDNE